MARTQLIAVALVFSLCIHVSLTSAGSTKFDYCDKSSSYDVKITGLEITPYPVRAGEAANFSIAASTDEPIAGGKLVIDVYFIGLRLHSETHNICSETTCPISAGDFKISHSQELPGYTPPGSYKLKLRMKDDKNRQLTCISFNLSIQWAADSDSVAES